MSFLAGRLAGKEGAYFFQESKQAVGRLVEKKKPNTTTSISPASSSASANDGQTADILPEVLRHSLPSKILYQQSSSSSLSSSKWNIHSPRNDVLSSVSPDALNPLRAYLSMPQVTFGPKRWQLPLAENSVRASTANDLRHDQYAPQANPEKLKAAAEGLAQVGKAFAVATTIIFGSAALTFGLAASKLEIHSSDDIRAKGRDLVQPKLETLQERFVPIRNWAESMSKKWHMKADHNVKDNPMIKELSKILGAKTSE
ncbi:hypothetical protein Ancab_031770 [Ancistrocladus abbreviatus]